MERGYVLLQRVLAELTTNAGLLEATEGDLWMKLIDAVDLHKNELRVRHHKISTTR